MEIYPLIQAKLLLYTFYLGALVGVICDVFRLFCSFFAQRRFLRTVIRALGDLFAVGLASLGIVVLCYYFNNGDIRFFCFVGLFLGFFIYRRTLSILIVNLLKLIYRVSRAIICFFLTPIVKFFIFLLKILKNVSYYIVKPIEKLLLLVYNISIYKVFAKIKGFVAFKRANGKVRRRKCQKENISPTEKIR